jgi:hypothetical protein
VAELHRTTTEPGKPELLAAWLPRQPWWVGGDRSVTCSVTPAGQAVIELVRVLAGDAAPGGAAGFVEAGWSVPDGTAVRGPVALLR